MVTQYLLDSGKVYNNLEEQNGKRIQQTRIKLTFDIKKLELNTLITLKKVDFLNKGKQIFSIPHYFYNSFI